MDVLSVWLRDNPLLEAQITEGPGHGKSVLHSPGAVMACHEPSLEILKGKVDEYRMNFGDGEMKRGPVRTHVVLDAISLFFSGSTVVVGEGVGHSSVAHYHPAIAHVSHVHFTIFH